MDSNRGPVDYGGYPPRRRPHASPPNRAQAVRRTASQDDAGASEIGGGARLTDREFEAWQHEQNPQVSPQGSPQGSRAKKRVARARHPQRGRLNPRMAQSSGAGANGANQANASGGTRRKKRGVKRPFWKRVRRLAGFLVLCALIEIGVASLTAPQFAVESVEVAGLQVTQPEELQPVQQWLRGQNWMRAKLSQAQKRVEALPAVRQARIVRVLQWPPRLQVQVSERQAFARVGAGKDWWIVDESGVPFRRAGKEDASLHAVTSVLLQPQLGRALPPEHWQPAVRLAGLLDAEAQAGRAWKLRRVYFDKNDCASLRLSGGFNDELLVQLGAAGWRDKLQSARQALAFFAATGQRAASLNLVSSYNRPAWTPRETTVLTSSNASSARASATSTFPVSTTLAAPDLSAPLRPDTVHRAT